MREAELAQAATGDPKATVRSALWSAYGDAVGFISELTSPDGLRSRIGASSVTRPVAWRRQIGGRFGVYAELPPGCYSDDTELRLATCRAIRGDGHFDVEAFAKIELPVWLSYALGGGKSTRAAATNLTRQDVNWFSNFFESRGLRYEDAGGNGSAMRIQPHVWAAARRADYWSYAVDIVRNTVATHGHPRALAGALFHGFCLGFSFENRSVPGPPDWKDFVESFPKCAKSVREDGDLATFWLPSWESRFGVGIEAALARIVDECKHDLAIVEDARGEADRFDYEGMVRTMGALDHNSRGSATKTAIAAAALSWAYRYADPQSAIERAANLLASDTDTIATMTGAILGSVADSEPSAEILDSEYIAREATRLHAISSGIAAESFQYPDLMKWKPPQSQADALVVSNGGCSISGLGRAQLIGESLTSRGRSDAAWQWVRLYFGQTVFVKRRSRLPSMIDPNGEDKQKMHDSNSRRDARDLLGEVLPLFERNREPGRASDLDRERVNYRTRSNYSDLSLDDATKEVIQANFDPGLIGRWLLYLSAQEDGIERAIAFAAIIAKARRARSKSQR